MIVVSGDTAGWIVPCGCTANQSGGLARRARFVADQSDHEVVLLDAGGAPAGTTPYHRVKFEAILRGEMAMGIAAALVISDHTVARHVQNIFAKLRVSSRAAATAFAFKHELI